MLNRIFKSGLIGVFALVMVVSFSSCKKEKETIAVIIVKNTSGNVVSGVTVVLSPEQIISPNGSLPDPALTKFNTTDANGRVQFTYELEAILNVKATKKIDNDNFEGNNIIRLLKGKTTTIVIEISEI